MTLVNVPIKKLENLPSRMVDLSIVGTNIESTEGLPQRVDGIMEIRDNKALKSIGVLPDVVMKKVFWSNNGNNDETVIRRIKCNDIKIK